jgi:hypothetical protein
MSDGGRWRVSTVGPGRTRSGSFRNESGLADRLSLHLTDALKRVPPPCCNKLQIFWKDLFYKNYSLSSFHEKKGNRAIYCSKEEGPALARPLVSTIQNQHCSDHLALFQHNSERYGDNPYAGFTFRPGSVRVTCHLPPLSNHTRIVCPPTLIVTVVPCS